MTAGAFGRVPRVALLVGLIVLGSATLTFAATSTVPTAPPQAAAVPAQPQTLVVPDVRGQAYVFAKSALEQAGLAWRVEGGVRGFAANVVAQQSPAAGAKVVDSGAPVIVLRLTRNGSYKEQGVPEDRSPYPGTVARLAGAKTTPLRPVQKQAPAKPAPARSKPAKARPAAAVRTPAFVLPGAPKEPLDEMPLAARADRLAAWVEAHPRRTPARVNHWLYQHNWIVTGAGFGWSSGEEALRTLVAVDRRVQKLWGVGGRSEQVARRALAEVVKRSR
jgi:hypothetical protein